MPHSFSHLTRPLTSPGFDVRFGQWVCWFAAVTVLLLGLFKLSRLPVNEIELFFGVLLVLAVSLLGVILGMVLPLASSETPAEVRQRSL